MTRRRYWKLKLRYIWLGIAGKYHFFLLARRRKKLEKRLQVITRHRSLYNRARGQQLKIKLILRDGEERARLRFRDIDRRTAAACRGR